MIPVPQFLAWVVVCVVGITGEEVGMRRIVPFGHGCRVVQRKLNPKTEVLLGRLFSAPASEGRRANVFFQIAEPW